MDKPENELITKKTQFGPRSGSPRPILGAAMHDIGYTKAWLLAGALWLFFVPDLVCALTPGPTHLCRPVTGHGAAGSQGFDPEESPY